MKDLQRHHHYGICFLVGLLVFVGFSSYNSPKAEALTDIEILIDNSGDFLPTTEFYCTGSPGTCTLRSALFGLFLADANVTTENVTEFHDRRFIIKFSPSISSVNLAGDEPGDIQELKFAPENPCPNCIIEIDGLLGRVSPIKIIGEPTAHGLIVSDPTHQIIIKNVNFQNFSDAAVVVKDTTMANIIDGNIFGSLGSEDPSSLSNNTAIQISNASNITISNNQLGGHSGAGIVLTGANTFNTTLSKNTIGVNPSNIGTARPPVSGNGIRIESGAHDNLIKGGTDKNIIAHTGQNGISISAGNNNKIEEGNVWFENSQKATELTAGGNSSIAKPVLTSAVEVGSDIHVKGTGMAGAQINFYRANNSSNPSVTPDAGGGEGFFSLQNNIIDAGGDLDASPGAFDFIIAGASLGETFTSFQTSALNSSEFSNNVIAAANQPPVANPTAAPSNPSSGTVVTLSANASDPDGDSLTFSWTQVTGPPVAISGDNTANASFTVPPLANDTNFSFSVTVSDGFSSISANVSVNALASGPSANAGPDQIVSQGDSVMLNGSGSSDPNNDPLTYSWTQSGSDAYPVILTNQNTVTPTFTAPNISELSTDLHFTLTVTDISSLSDTDMVTITVNRSQQKPVAKLKIFPTTNVLPGTQIILNGAESVFDPTTSTQIYKFRQITSDSSSSSLIINQANPNSPEASVFMPAGITSPTEFTFELIVNDGIQDSNPDTETVTVSPQAPATPPVCSERAPEASAGLDMTFNKIPGEIVTLSGIQTSDPDNNLPLTYFWRQQAGGIRVDIRNNQSSQPNFTVPAITTPSITIVFQLTVTDSCGLTDTDDVRITLNNSDPDFDNLDNLRETELQTNPENPDTDADKVPDGVEVRSGCMNPLDPDTDNDGLKDGEEDTNKNGITEVGETNPCNADTDGDTMPDGFERQHQLNANDPRDATEDPDKDTLLNKEEFVFKTNPKVADTDGDGLLDGVEAKGANKTSANDSDSDDDGITDGNEDINHDGITQSNETSPVRFDTDFDGLSDGQEIGLAQPQSKGADLKKFKPDLDPLSKTGPLTADTDADKIPDGVEDANKNGSFDCGESNPLSPDNTLKSCTPTPTRTARTQTTAGPSISVSPGTATRAPIVTITPGASISVQGSTTAPGFVPNPQASIVVFPGILTSVGPAPLLPSIMVLAAGAVVQMMK